MEKHNLLTRWVWRVALISVLSFSVWTLTGPDAAAQQQAKPVITQEKPVISAADRPINNLQDLNNAFVGIAAQVIPTVVTVSTEKIISGGGMSPFANDPFFQFFFGGPNNQNQQGQGQKYVQQGLGSGVIVSADGYILTNNHVIDGADSITVGTLDGKKYPGKVVGADPETDIAVVKIEASNLPFIRVGDSDKLRVGELVMAVGSPMSPNLAHTVTQGIVSAVGRSNIGLADYEDFIQTDAAINPGNSGGPLVNMDGELVGINSAIVSQSGGFQGIGFAVPSNMAVRIMNALITSGKVVRGWLGVSIQDINQQIAKAMNLTQTSGALIGDVVADSPADSAGLKAGDIITSVNGKTVKNTVELRNQIASTAPGTKVTLGINRDGKMMDVAITLGELPSTMAGGPGSSSVQQKLGFSVSNLTADLARQYGLNANMSGVVVMTIDQTSNAFRSGLRQGDLIVSINKQPVKNVVEFNKVMSTKKSGETVLLRISRQGNSFYIAFTL